MKYLKLTLRLFCFVALLCSFAFTNTKQNPQKNAIDIENIEIYNGTTYIYQNPHNTTITYNDKPLRLISHPSKKGVYFTFIPVGYYEKESKVFKDKDKPLLQITIKQKDYPKEQINVANDKINYSEQVAQRIEQEKNEIVAIYENTTNGRLWNKPFIKPLDSIITSHYGSARVFNNTIKSYHGGTDFRAEIGTKIKASNSGKVALVQDRFLSGKTIVIDHGEGVYSIYFHLSKFKVKEGDFVKRGQTIAKSGDTGRVSGAHLHFGFVINGINVDAMDFIDQVNTTFFKGAK